MLQLRYVDGESPSVLFFMFTLKAPITTAADDILKFFFFLFFKENKSWFLADDSHEISRLVFFDKIKKNENKMSSATNFAWRFKG